MTAQDIVAAIDDGRPLGREVASLHIGTSGAASTTFGMLGQITRGWLDDDDGSLQAVLCTGLSGVESARAPTALWALARLALDSPEVLAAIAADRAADALSGLRLTASPRARAWIAAYDAFIERFGHRSVMEAELAAPAWAEDPATVFSMLRSLIAAGPEADPDLGEARQRAAREQATKECRRRLPFPRRLVFDQVLKVAQRYVREREHTKSLLVRGSHRTRLLLRALGCRLADAGLIGGPGDIFYLTWDEARGLALGSDGGFATDRVRRRRQEEARNRAVSLPETFFGRPQPLGGAEPARVATLRGIPVSPGIVTGIARVILDPRESSEIAPGEILVAPVTDAGWTPLFLAAAAVVVDIGGPLSHGATVARELGLPAVVNVKQGTTLIRSGQRITVNGAAGTVEIEPSS
jgi:pyruvate,water dikinase